MSACGLDFGTSNTTLGTLRAGAPALAALEDGKTTIPSAVFFPLDAAPLIGRAAVEAYVDGHSGRLMRSLKSVLGSGLIDETTPVGGARVRFRDVIATYLSAVKARAEANAGTALDRVVHGRPVHFVDDDPEGDAKAEATLREIAGEIGFSEVSFQFEPIAAAFDYERGIAREEIALIADIGGGTSDFSIVRLSPDRHASADRQADILANDGVRIGGTDFDRKLSLGTIMPLLGFRSAMKRAGLDVPSRYFHELATWSSINRLYTSGTLLELAQVRREAVRPDLIDRLARVLDEQRGHTLAIDVEAAKIDLSDTDKAAVSLDWIEAGLEASIGRGDLERHTGDLASRIARRIGNCLRQAGLRAEALDALFLTGGSARLPHVRRAIAAAAPAARLVDGDTFGAVGKGLTVEAQRRYGS